jgi:AraC-like DNA-binding protein
MWAVRGTTACSRVGILPTGCVEVMFTLGPPHRVVGEPATARDVDCRGAWVSGLQPSVLTVDSPDGTDLVGLALRPLGAAAYFPLPMDEIAGRVLDLADLFPAESPESRARMLAARSASERLALLAGMLDRRLERGREVHADVRLATAAIERRGGNVRIRDLCGSLGVSNKLLISRFKEHVGLSPKVYARVLRFRRIVERVRDQAEVDWADIACEHGYFDQPHFTHEFREFAGCTPRDYLRLRTPDGESVVSA